jgi:hypothetical protein
MPGESGMFGLSDSARRAAGLILGILIPLAVALVFLLMSYTAGRKGELARRNQHALAAIAQQLGTRLEAARDGFGSACPSRSELEKIDLPGWRITLPPAPANGDSEVWRSTGSTALMTVTAAQAAKAAKAKTSRAACDGSRAGRPRSGWVGTGRPCESTSRVRMRLRRRQILLKMRGCKASVSLDEFMRGVGDVPDAFDTLTLAERRGTVLGQVGVATGRILRLEDIPVVDDDRKDDRKVDRRLALPLPLGVVQHVQLAGEPHWLYAERVQVSGSRPHGALGKNELVLLAFVPDDRFTAEQRTLPYWWVLGIAAFIVLCGLSWPVLKLWFMGPNERVTNVDVRVLVMTSILGTAVIAVIVVGALTVRATARVFDAQLGDLATTIATRLEDEVRVVREQLDRTKQLIAAQRPLRWGRLPGCLPFVPFENATQLNPGPTVLIDRKGNPLCRWEPDAPDGNLCLRVMGGMGPCFAKRRYFSDARARNRLWDNPCTPDGKFAVEVVHSKFTGTDLLAVASSIDEMSDAPAFDPKRGPLVLVVSRHPTAFRRPILPQGFSFALVDSQGQVQLHSDSRRNVEENLIAEVVESAKLEAILSARKTDFLQLRYAGNRYRALVRPLDFGTWSLVVMHDEQEIEGLLTEVLARWAFVFIGFLSLYGFGLVALQIINERYQAPWLWPSREAVGAAGYVVAAAVVLSLIVRIVVAFAGTKGPERALVLYLAPLAIIVVLYFVLAAVRTTRKVVPAAARRVRQRLHGQAGQSGPTTKPVPRWFELGFRLSYAVLIWFLLIALSGVPSALLWRDVFETTLGEYDALVEHRIGDAAEARRAEIRDLYVRHSPQYPPGGEDAVGPATYEWRKPFSSVSPPTSDGGPTQLSMAIRSWLPVYSDAGSWLRSACDEFINPLGIPFWPADATTPALMPPEPFWRAMAFVWFVVVSFIALGAVWSVVTRLFLLDADRPDVLDAPPTTETSHAVAVWLHYHGVTGPRAGIPVDPARTLDLRWVSGDRIGQWFKDTRSIRDRVIVALEARLGDSESEERLLDALEACIARDEHLLIASSVEPLRRLEAIANEGAAGTDASDDAAGEAGTKASAPHTEPASSGDRAAPRTRRSRANLARWARVLAAFCVERIDVTPGQSDPLSTLLLEVYGTNRRSSDNPAEAVDDDDAAWHRTMWEQSTLHERLVMRRLAEESFSSPRDIETVRALFRRRLIHRDGQILFASRSLRRFVLRAETEERIQKWERALGKSTWAQVSGPLQATLAVAGVVLLWTQEELRSSAIAVPAAVTSALPLLVQLLSKLGSDNSGSRNPK